MWESSRPADVSAFAIAGNVLAANGRSYDFSGRDLAGRAPALTPIPASVELWSIGLGITITALVGLFFGLYPAMRAASLDPIEALRRD